jgi:ubiquinone/menaquinone biosynthesis C-methylase UbiE
VPYDPTLYQGAAANYARGRPPYSAQLVSTLATELGLDGSGRLLDVGCGPGSLTIELAGTFDEAVGLDPDADMLAEGMRCARAAGIENVRWVRALAEDIPKLNLGAFMLVTFGQSFQWTDRERVAEAVYDIVEPGGALALIVHAHEGRLAPNGPPYPLIPHDEIHALIRRYLGPRRRAGQGFRTEPPDRYEDALARTRFGAPRSVFAPGRADIVRDVDGVVAGFSSMSFAVPHLFGEWRDAFEADLRALLAARSETGLFWDWPGDTAIMLARKP